MNYEIWHDENKNEGAYWHGILFVPVQKKARIITLLKLIRDNHGYDYLDKIKFAGSSKSTNKRKQYLRNILITFLHILQVKPQKTNLINRTAKDIYEKRIVPYYSITDLFGCKFGLLKIADNHSAMYDTMTYDQKIETTFRFIMKSCLHSMFSPNNPVNITKFLFDGYSHRSKGGGNPPNVRRIFRDELRNYVTISDKLEVDYRKRVDRKDNTGLIIDFVDNIVGGLEAAISHKSEYRKVVFSLEELISRLRTNKIFSNFNGRWYKSISCSECSFKDGAISFPDIFRNPKQMTLL